MPRLKPGAAVIIITTRWHEDDLVGRLLVEEPERWRVLNIPMEAEALDDPLGRPIGAQAVARVVYGRDGRGCQAQSEDLVGLVSGPAGAR